MHSDAIRCNSVHLRAFGNFGNFRIFPKIWKISKVVGRFLTLGDYFYFIDVLRAGSLFLVALTIRRSHYDRP